MTDIRQSVNYASYLESQGWIVERIEDTNYFIRKLPLLGSVLKVQRPETISKVCLSEVKKLEKKYRVFQTIIEPDLGSSSITEINNHILLSSNGCRLSKSPFLPSKTIHLDLKLSETDIFRSFSKETRYSIRKGEGLIVKDYSTPEKIVIFHKAWKKSVNFNRYVPSLESLLKFRKSFPQSYSTFLTSHNKSGDIIGGALFTRSSHDFGYYWYGFTNKEGRTSLSQYSLLYSGILWAKRMGCKKFDFEGIYDERFPDKSWLGFTRFKKSFGGTEISYSGCYTKFRFPF